MRNAFPYPGNFKNIDEYEQAVDKWEKEEKLNNLQNINKKFNISAFLRRPNFCHNGTMYTRRYPNYVDQLAIYEYILSEKPNEKIKYWISDKDDWTIIKISNFPIPELYDNYTDFKNDAKKWFDKETINVQKQFENSSDIIGFHYGKTKKVTRMPFEEKVENFKNFHPSTIFNFLLVQNHESKAKIYPKQHITLEKTAKLSQYVEKNEFYKKCNQMSATVHITSSQFLRFINTKDTNFSNPVTTNQNTEELIKIGPLHPIIPIEPMSLKTSKNRSYDKTSLKEFIRYLNLPIKALFESNDICANVMHFVYSPLFLKPDIQFIFTNEKLLFHLMMICWRFNLTGKPSYHPHFESSHKVPTVIRKFWSYSVRSQFLNSLICTFGSLQKSRKILSLISSQKKAISTELISFLKNNENVLIDFMQNVSTEEECLVVTDILISVLSDQTNSAYLFVAASPITRFDFIKKVTSISPLSFKVLTSYVAFSPDIAGCFLTNINSWEFLSYADLTPAMLRFLFLLCSTKPQFMPNCLFSLRSLDWAMAVISNIMQTIGKSADRLTIDTALRIISFVIRCSRETKKCEMKNWETNVGSLFAVISSAAAVERDKYCLAREIEACAILLKEPFLAVLSLPLICRSGDSHYDVAHTGYKVLKAVALNNKAAFFDLLQKKKEVLRGTFLMMIPATKLDMMKFLARFISNNIPIEHNNVGFFGASAVIPIEIISMIQFLYECQLEPKKVAQLIKKIVPRPPEIARNVSSMKELQICLAKRPTLTKLFLFGGNTIQPQK